MPSVERIFHPPLRGVLKTPMDSILLGYSVATFDDGKGTKGSVIASGATLRVHVDGFDGYVDLEMDEAINSAIGLIQREG